MADSSTIREFLVGLGFRIDEAGQKKFKDGVEDATKQTEKLDKANQEAGKTILRFGASFLAVGAMVSRGALDFAGKLEDLHFASRRVGASASNLRAMANAAKDVGVSANEALSSVEGVARFMRNNPGGESFIQGLGVQTRKANGELRDTVDIVNDLGKELAKRPQWLAQSYGSELGINETHLLGMRNPEYWKEFEKSHENFQRSGIDSQSDKAHGLMKQWRDFTENIEGTLGPTGKWAAGTGLGVVGSVLAYFAAKSAVQSAVGAALGGSAGTGTGAAAAAAGGAAGNAAGAAASAAGGTAAGGAATSAGVLSRVLPWFGRLFGGAGLMLYSRGTNEGEAEELAKRRDKGPTISTGSQLASSEFGRLIAKGEGDYNSVNLGKRGGYRAGTADLENMTLDEVMKAQREGRFNAAGRYQVVKDTLLEAARKMGLGGSEKFGKELQDRIFEYLVTSKRSAIGNYLTGKGSSLMEAIGAAAKEWASVANPATGRSYYDGVGSNKSSITVEQMERALSNTRALLSSGRDIAAREVGLLARDGKPQTVKFEQKTEIKVIGASNPARVATEVAQRQGDVNEELFRNFESASS
ncbi:hypothetical protein BKK79_35750 [Cupriavidus sp. USMAA2-4]|uniref:hypothetical protein n=1 Tax=Cupriavidus sp. USMAA2-4 TaxID=876364 RepID=UPI0008A667CF|nr:hypothetical protein [Cupriavidus sp. USMAA2-4]AOY96850.1 hypothetical protein BKK79_35750 [Cupriavidus sp. USMAA2-4]